MFKVIDRTLPNWSKIFFSTKECENWLFDGLFSCERAERDHYVNMLYEFRNGKHTLHYN